MRIGKNVGKTISHFGILIFLAGCSVDVQSPQQPVPQEKARAWGPIETTVLDAAPYENSFNIPINQAFGKQDYFITQADLSYLQIKTSAATVGGCDPKQVAVDQVWFEDATHTVGVRVPVGESFRALAGRRGLLQIVFRNLTGCTSLGYTFKIQKI